MTHINAIIDNNDRPRDELRKAKVTKNKKQGAVGVPVFFSSEDIEKQGIDPDSVERIGVRIEDGFIIFVPMESEIE